MTLEELAALLDLAEKHPRVASLTMGDVTVQFAGPPAGELVPVEEDEGDPSLPAEVYDPRKKLAEIHRKYRAKAS